jgi:hypothetical protein
MQCSKNAVIRSPWGLADDGLGLCGIGYADGKSSRLLLALVLLLLAAPALAAPCGGYDLLNAEQFPASRLFS